MDALRLLAQELGVLTSYTDWKGEQRQAAPEVLMQVLALLGTEIDRVADAPAALAAFRYRQRQALAPPCAVAWDDEPAEIELLLPAGQQGPYTVELTLESGQKRVIEGSLTDAPLRQRETSDGNSLSTRCLSVPVGEPGYHQAMIQAAGRFGQCLIIAAPRRGHSNQGGKRWGMFAPLYGLRTGWSDGIGDLSDLATLARRSGELGASFIGTLPLLASYLDEPYEYSPYSPVSRLFWNELYLDPVTAPGFSGCEAARRLMRSPEHCQLADELRQHPLIDYRQQMAHRRTLLEALSDHAWSSSELQAAIEDHARRHPQVAEYARFRAKTERLRRVWTQWDNPDSRSIADGEYDDRVRRYHLYVQFAMDAELALLSRSSDVSLYLDLPVGVNRCGYDTWRERDIFVIDASAGAPPDALFLAGQNWGLAPLHPVRLRQSGYRYLIDCVRHHVEHAGLLRVDHVMGLHRLYWIPEGVSAKEGMYVEYNAAELYAILCLESARHRCTIVGENLGTVPDYVPPTMRRHGFLGLYVGQFGMGADEAADEDIEHVPGEVVASLNTHDMPTFAGFWRGRDIEDRRRLELIADENVPAELEHREQEQEKTTAFLAERGFLRDGEDPERELFEMMRGITLYLAASDAQMMLLNVEDLWLETEPQNVPGTMGPDWPNWRRKLRRTIDEFMSDDEILDLLQEVERHRSLQRLADNDPPGANGESSE